MSGSLMFTTLLTICFVFIVVIVIVVCIRCFESRIFSPRRHSNQPDSKPEYDLPDSLYRTVIINYYSTLLRSKCFTSSLFTSSLTTSSLFTILVCEYFRAQEKSLLFCKL